MFVFLHTLKFRLLFLIYIVALPGLLAVFFQATTERNKAIEVARDRAVAVVEYIKDEQVNIIEDTQIFLTRLSKSPILLNPASPECSHFLANLRSLTENYVNLGAPRADGELLCNSYPLNKRVNVADRPYIQEAIKNRAFSIGKFQIDRAAQTTSINFAYPVINPKNDEFVALIVAVVSLDWWSKRLDHSSLPKNSVAYITDSEHKIIAAYPENKKQLGLSIGEVQGVAHSISDNQINITEDSEGHLRIFVNKNLIATSSNRSVNIIVGISFEEELATINSQVIYTATLFTLIIFLITLFAIWGIDKNILAPLKKLRLSTKQLTLGLHSDAHQLKGVTELVELQTQFSTMAKTRLHAEQQLKQSQVLLQESQEVLSRHLKNTPLGTLSWDENFICTEWNRAASNIFEYSAEEAIGCNIIELIVPSEQQEKFIKNYNLLLEQKGGSHCESQHITKYGHTITCNWYNTLIQNKEGVTNRIGTLVQNITTDKRNQNTLDKFFELPMNLHLIAGFDGSIVRVNETWGKMLGYVSAELLGHNFLNFVHQEDIDLTTDEILKLEKGQTTFNFENRYRTKTGSFRLIAWSATASVTEQTIYAVGTDITERRISEDKLKLAAGVFTHAKEAIIITDAMSNIIDVNTTFMQLSGYSSTEIIGKTPSIFKSHRQSSPFYSEMWQSINNKGHWSGEIWNKRKNGEIYPQLVTISSVSDSVGKVQNFIGLYTDITDIKAHQKQLEHIAHYDVLTNLPNRTLLSDRLLQAMPQCKRHNTSLAVAFLDLDGFKEINDMHGHAIGDKLLVETGQRMEEVLRDGDTLSRFGGDEFIAVLVGLETPLAWEKILNRLLEVVSAPMVINNIILNISASIGVTIYPHDGVDAEQLLRHADQAMYTAKQKGKNRYHLFDMAEDIALKYQHDNLIRIRSALKDDELVLFYQPKVNMKTGELIGAEALIRWQHPERGLLLPIEFLPAIEHHELTIMIGEWVINSALNQISAWQKRGLNITISVNIDALHLQQGCFAQRLSELFAAHPDVQPSALELEVLETSKLGDIEEVSKIMHDCIQLGVNFSLDDFGTGYCSLTYLKQLPVNLIKIDQSFIRGMLDDPDDLSIVKGVIGLSRAFQREVIAEGVETQAHGTALLRLGCYLAQGYGIAKPMPAALFPDWANTWRPDNAWLQIKED